MRKVVDLRTGIITELPSLPPAKQPKPTAKEKADALKFAGVKFEGILCSAEAEDMWGLASIKDFIQKGNSTKFVFKNGNTLLLTPDNLAEFQSVWIPFRFGFFK